VEFSFTTVSYFEPHKSSSHPMPFPLKISFVSILSYIPRSLECYFPFRFSDSFQFFKYSTNNLCWDIRNIHKLISDHRQLYLRNHKFQRLIFSFIPVYKIKKSRLMRSPFCACVCICVSPHLRVWTGKNYEDWPVFFDKWRYFRTGLLRHFVCILFQENLREMFLVWAKIIFLLPIIMYIQL
jgi:hypothetical protein